MKVTVRKASEADTVIICKALLESSRAGKQVGLFDFVFQTSNDTQLLDYLQRLTTVQTKCYCHYSNFFPSTIYTICTIYYLLFPMI